MPDFDLKFIDDGLERKLNKMGKMARPIARKAMKASANRVQAAVVAATPVDTGELKAAMAAAKVRALRGRNITGAGVAMPADARNARVASVIEYGRPGVAPEPYIRNTVDRETPVERKRIGQDIGAAIEKVTG